MSVNKHTGNKYIKPQFKIVEMNDDLGETETAIFRPYEAEIEDGDDKKMELGFRSCGRMNIHLWGLDPASNPILIRIVDFPIICYIKLPVIDEPWGSHNSQQFFNYLKYRLNDHAPTGYDIVDKAFIHYYSKDSYAKFMIITFNTVSAARHCSNLFNKEISLNGIGEKLQFKMYDQDIHPARKLFTLKQVRFTSWLKIQGRSVKPGSENRISESGNEERPAREYICSYQTLEANPESYTLYPRILSFDIETYSDRHNAMPNSLNDKHVMNMISCVYRVLRKPESQKKILIVLGECPKIEGSEVICCETEYDMILAKNELMRRFDPEIITGYNIYLYDYPYMDLRIKPRFLDWPQMGRLIGKKSDIVHKKWQSAGMGIKNLSILRMNGRITVDMIEIMRNTYSNLEKYSLDYVCRKFIGRGKHDVKAVRMFKAYEQYLDSLKPATSLHQKSQALNEIKVIAEYCIEDSTLVIDLFEKLHVWVALTELSSIVGVTVMDISTKGQQIRCFSQIFDKSALSNYIIDRREKTKLSYTGATVLKPVTGLSRNIITLDFQSLYPSIIMAFNICYTTLVKPEDMDKIDPKMCHILEFDQLETVGEPAPSSEEGGDGDAGEEDVPFGEGEEFEKPAKGKKAKKEQVMKHYKFMFVKREYRDGIVPQIVRRLVDERKAVRKEIKGLEKELEKIVDQKVKSGSLEFNERIDALSLDIVTLDKRQLALKVSANSVYGFLGAQSKGLLPFIEGAISVTGMGRQLINQVKDYIEAKGGRVVYGDTDSAMIDLNIKDPMECLRMGKQLMDEISGCPEVKDENGVVIKEAIKGLFPPPLGVDFEKGMSRLLCLTPKRYVYYQYNKDGTEERDIDTGELVLHKKGVSIARRDICNFFRQTYTALLRSVMDSKSVFDSFRIICEACAQLMNYEVDPLKDLTITMGLGTNYKSNCAMKIFADQLRILGKPANPGDRLEFIFVKSQNEKDEGHEAKQGYKMRASEIWAEDKESGAQEDVDVRYYLEHKFVNPIDQLFEIGHREELKKYEALGYTPQFCRRRHSPFSTPVKMLTKIISDYYKYLEGHDDVTINKFIAQIFRVLPDQFETQKC